MTKRERLIKDVRLHLRGRNPQHITGIAIQEAITDLGLDDVADDYDWTRLRNAIAREHFDSWTRRDPRSELRMTDVPALA